MENTTLVERLRKLATEITGIADHTATTSLGTSSDDPARRAEALVTRFLDLVDAGELDQLATVVHTDITYVIPGRSRISGIYEGVDAMTTAMTVLPRNGAADLQTKLTDLVAAADSVASFHELSGTLDGRTQIIDLALRFELRDGLIARITEYSANQYDTDDLFA